VIKLLLIIFIAFVGFSCSGKEGIEWRRPAKNMAQTWEEYYKNCLDQNPDNKEKCEELKEDYLMEFESTQQMGIEPDTGQQPYYE